MSDLTRTGVKILHLGRDPKVVTLDETQQTTIGDLIQAGHVSAQAEQYFLNGRQVPASALVKNGDGLVTLDKVSAGA